MHPQLPHWSFEGRQEKWIFIPLVSLTLVLGIFPALILDIIGPSVNALVEHVKEVK